MLGVRYYLAYSQAAKDDGQRRTPACELVATVAGRRPASPRRDGASTRSRDAPLVAPLRNEPVVVAHARGDAVASASAPREPREAHPRSRARAVGVPGGPWWSKARTSTVRSRPTVRRRGARATAAAEASTPRRRLPARAGDQRPTSTDDSIRFRRVADRCARRGEDSDFPNWEAEGAQGPWRLTPNLMVVVAHEPRRAALRPDAAEGPGGRHAARSGRARGARPARASVARRRCPRRRPRPAGIDGPERQRPTRASRSTRGATMTSPPGSRVALRRRLTRGRLRARRDLQGLRHPRRLPRRDRRDRSPSGSGTRSSRFTGARRVIVGHDMRPSSVPLVEAFIEGVTLAGADVTDIGLASTDLVLLRRRDARRAGRDVHRQPQPRAVQRHQALPGRRGAGR